MNGFTYLLLFNVFAIPFIIYAQVKGPCNLIVSLMGDNAKVLCEYTTNPFLNLFYINAIFIMLALLIYANSQIVPSPPASAKKFPPKHT